MKFKKTLCALAMAMAIGGCQSNKIDDIENLIPKEKTHTSYIFNHFGVVDVYASCDSPRIESMATGDFDGDGDLDLAISIRNCSDPSLIIYENKMPQKNNEKQNNYK